MILSAQQLSIHFGMRPILQQADFYLEDHDKVGIVGLNGAGKSTLLRLLAGAEEADAGQVILSAGVRRSFLPQRPDMDADASVLAQVMADAQSSAEYECKAMLQRLGLEDYNAPVGTLSGGQRKRAALAAALLRPAELLLLDEPTNHLDSESIIWLEDYLRAFRGSLVMVTHDRYFLERVCNRIVEVDRGKLYCYEANYSRYLALKAGRLEMAEAAERKRQALLRRELLHLGSSPAYMLNSAMGTLGLLVLGGVSLWKADLFARFAQAVPEGVPVLVCCAVCAVSAVNFLTTPSVSLEGKQLWLAQSLPVSPWQVLRAKLRLQLLITVPPMLLCLVCLLAVYPGSPLELLFIAVTALSYALLMALLGLFLGLKMPNLSWTNEVVPIKQSACVALSLFSGWAVAMIPGALYLLTGIGSLDPLLYLSVVTALVLILSAVLSLWVKKTGSRIFAAL